MSVELYIAKALNKHAASLPLPDGTPLVFSNYGLNPNADSYVRVDDLPRETSAPLLGFDSALDYGGIYQLSVSVHLSKGEAEAISMVSTIMKHFRRGLKMPYWTSRGPSWWNYLLRTALTPDLNMRLGQAYRSPPMITDTHYTVVVSVPYRAIIKPALFN